MTRIEITVGLLATMITVAIMALYGTRENERMATSARSFDVRSIERGSEMFDRYCATCHAFNAAGGKCPPLDERSGLHGGDLGGGVAWRLEDLGWDKSDTFGYVYQTIEAGRAVSTRPWAWVGNRTSPDAGMAMPAWGQNYNGPLRPDQVRDITNYIVNFRAKLPDDADKAKVFVAGIDDKVMLSDAPQANPRPDGSDPVALGAWLFADSACATCHSVEAGTGPVTGPNLAGFSGTSAERIAAAAYTGSATTAADYVRESIVNPGAFVVEGFQNGVMPATFANLPAADLDALVAYLLGGGAGDASMSAATTAGPTAAGTSPSAAAPPTATAATP